ncbi:transposase, partial [Streptomyces sp. NPDC051104]
MASTFTPGSRSATSANASGTYVLDHLWRRLKIDRIVGQVGQPKRGRCRDMSATERVLFSMVA